MNAAVIRTALIYTAYIKRMQNTFDRTELAWMEDDRNRLHNEFLDALKEAKMKISRPASEVLAWKIRDDYTDPA